MSISVSIFSNSGSKLDLSPGQAIYGVAIVSSQSDSEIDYSCGLEYSPTLSDVSFVPATNWIGTEILN